ncbi:hypothetical protein HDU82_006991 [Entophlyctis luteolus]|nr:hypothetical protein HDU82_006991 [Entophlyctis luteolus]
MKESRNALKQQYIDEGKLLPDNAQITLNDAITMVGECLDMCPLFERHEREYQNGLHDFEKKTLDYLFHDIIDEYGFDDKVHGFLRDRTRGIRNDFTLQNYREYEAIECHERIARFHILSAARLCGGETTSLQQEQEQMRKTLISLREYYADMRNRGISCPNEPEFQAYFILSHLWQCEIVSFSESQLDPETYLHEFVQLAISLQQCIQCGVESKYFPTKSGSNWYTRFFRILEKETTPYLFAAILNMEFPEIRCNALRTINKTLLDLKPHYPVLEIAQNLGYDNEEDAAEDLEKYGFEVKENESGVLVVMIGKDPPNAALGTKIKSKPFAGHGVSIKVRPSLRLVESKARDIAIAHILDGKFNEHSLPVSKVPGYTSLLQPDLGSTELKSSNETSYSKLSAEAPIFIPSGFFGSSLSDFSTPREKRQHAGFSESPIFAEPTPKADFSFTGFGNIPKSPQKTFQMPDEQPIRKGISTSTTDLPKTSSPFSAFSQKPDSVVPSAFPSLSFIPIPAIPSESHQHQEKFIPPANITFQLPPLTISASSSNTLATSSESSQLRPAPPAQDLQIPQSHPTVVREKEAAPPTVQEISILNSLVDVELKAIARAEVVHDKYIRGFANDFVESEVGECISSVANAVFDDVKAMMAASDAHDVGRRLAFAFRAWLRGAVRRAAVREREKTLRVQRAVRFYRRLLESGIFDEGKPRPPAETRLGTTTINGDKALSNSTDRLSFDLTDEACTSSMSVTCLRFSQVKKMDSSFFKYIDIPGTVFRVLHTTNKQTIEATYSMKSSPRHLFWKLAVCTPAFKSLGGSPRSKMHSIWTCSKFGAGGDGGGCSTLLLTSSDKQPRGYMVDELLRVTVEMNDDGSERKISAPVRKGKRVPSRLSVCVVHVDIQQDAVYPLKVNAEALSSGTQAALFQFTCFGDNNEGHNEWWESERERLYSFLSTLPLGAQVPLLLLFFPNSKLGEDEFKLQAPFQLNIESMLVNQGGPVTAVDVVSIPESSFSDSEAKDTLVHGVEWLASMTPSQPYLRADAIRDVVEMRCADTFRYAVNRIEKLAFDIEFAMEQRMHVETFNTIIEIHNLQIQVLQRVLADPTMAEVPWPSVELSTALAVDDSAHQPRMTWNHPQTLKGIFAVLERFKLPPMPRPDDEGTESVSSFRVTMIKRRYEEYASAIRHILESPSSLMSQIWRQFSLFEKMSVMSARTRHVSNGTSKGVNGFAFGKMGLIFASEVVSSLKVELHALAERIGGIETPWYDVREVDSAVKDFEKKVHDVVGDWEARVLVPWRVATAERARLRATDSSEQSLEVSLHSEESPFVAKTPNAHHLVFDDPVGNLEVRTPLAKRMRDEVIFSGNTTPATSAATSGIFSGSARESPSSASNYALLKRRLFETVAETRADIARSRKRLSEGGP